MLKALDCDLHLLGCETCREKVDGAVPTYCASCKTGGSLDWDVNTAGSCACDGASSSDHYLKDPSGTDDNPKFGGDEECLRKFFFNLSNFS